MAAAAVVLAVLAATREAPGRTSTRVQVTPTPQHYFLGVPNSSYTVTIELTCPDAVNICNDLTDPIRQLPSLEALKVVVGHDYSPSNLSLPVIWADLDDLGSVQNAGSGDCAFLHAVSWHTVLPVMNWPGRRPQRDW